VDYTIDIDTGGTFTDGFFMYGNQIEIVKVPTTPHDLTVCFLECIKAGARRFDLSMEDLLYHTDIIRFSSTIGTNTIIQRDGSKLGLMVTIGRESLSPTSTEDGKSPLILKDMVIGIEEEISPTGKVIKTPDEQSVLATAQELIDRGARCLVVAFANSEFNPANEHVVRQTIKREYPRDFLGSVPVFLSSDISRRSGEAERINASVINAYIHAKLVRLLYKAGEDLRQRLYRKSLFIVHNNGTVARVAKTRAINTYNSGPVAGLLGARLIGKLYGNDDLISTDMGGTSFDIGYVHQGQVNYTLNSNVEGFPVNVPMLAVHAIGAGGGSIASVRNGKLQVGPQSAGALPGPVSFDLGGTEPTVTDADLILGILDPDYFLGGTIKLNCKKAMAAMEEKVAKPLGISLEEATLAIRKMVNSAMGQEIKRLKEEVWPNQEPLLVVYGGAGPAHCCDFAKVVGLKKIVITPFSAVFSAFSSSSMDVGHLYYQCVDLPFGEGKELKDLTRPIATMEREAERDMRGEGFVADKTNSALELFIHATDSGSEIKLPADLKFYEDPKKVKDLVQQAHKALAASGKTDAKNLILNTVSLLVQAPVPHYGISNIPKASQGVERARKGSRPVFLETTKTTQEVPVYERSRLTNGHQIFGPALVESENTTLFVSSGWKLGIDEYNNGILEEVS